MKNPNYSKEEDDYLRENYGKEPVSEMTETLNRTASSIRARANVLKLCSNIPNSKETHRKIADKQIKDLKESAYSLSSELVYLIGVLNGDGCLDIQENKNYAFRLAVVDKSFRDYVSKITEKWSGLKPCDYDRKDETYADGLRFESCLNSKKAVIFLYEFYISKNPKAIENIKSLLGKNEKEICKFIEGFFDSEGSFSGRIMFSNTNYHLINLIKNYLDFLGINTKIYTGKSRENICRGRKFLSKECHQLCIQYNQGISNFQKLIQSSIIRKNNNKIFFLNEEKYSFYFELVDSKNLRIFKEIINKYHSYKQTSNYFGKRINWIIKDKKTKETYGVIGIGNSFLFQGTRDKYVGWNKEQRLRNISKIANNWRFCLLPNASKNLASRILSLFRKESRRMWGEKYGIDLVLLETYIGSDKAGSCYKADNWIYIGDTKGKKIGIVDNKRKIIGETDKKKIFIVPLVHNWREELLN